MDDNAPQCQPCPLIPNTLNSFRPSAPRRRGRSSVRFWGIRRSRASSHRLTTLDPQTIHNALNGPNADELAAAMDAEMSNMYCLRVFMEVPHPHDRNIVTPDGFPFETSIFTKRKARLVACRLTQVSGVDYHDPPVVRLESFRVLSSIAALFDCDLQQSDVSAVYLHGGKCIWKHPRATGQKGAIWFLPKGPEDLA